MDALIVLFVSFAILSLSIMHNAHLRMKQKYGYGVHWMAFVICMIPFANLFYSFFCWTISVE